MPHEPTLTHLDPVQLLLHEEVEPARIEQLVAVLAAERRQREPVLVTPTEHGMFLLDGAHRTTALRRLGVPRIAALVVPAAEAIALTGWTHAVTEQGAQARLAELADRAAARPGPVVASIRTTGREAGVHADDDSPAALMAAFRLVAQCYQAGPYARLTEPLPAEPDRTEVVWQVPDLATIVTIAATVGVLPAGVTRFRAVTPPLTVDVGFEELGAPASLSS
ncbi:hypothetical protein [Oryzihumus sp.]